MILHFFFYALIAAEFKPAEETACPSLCCNLSRLLRACFPCCTSDGVKAITIRVTPPSPSSSALSEISTQKRELPADTNSLFVPDEPEELEKIRVSLREMRTLIVEDNEMSLIILKRFCQKIGIKNIEWAKNGQIGVQKFSDYKPHLIFMDRHMPVMDGIDATREIRALQLDWGIDPIIICISDDASEGNRENFKKAGANCFFHKPFLGGYVRLSGVIESYFEFAS